MKRLKEITLIVLLIIITLFKCKTALANDNSTYNFYITKNDTISSKKMTIFIANSIDEKTLINGKIAPRNIWKF